MPWSLPTLCDRSLATLARAAKPTGSYHLEPDGQTRGRVPASTAYPSSLAKRSLRRQTPKVGARCVNHARRDLCGGCAAMRIPTAIRSPDNDPKRLVDCLPAASVAKKTVFRTARRGAERRLFWPENLSQKPSRNQCPANGQPFERSRSRLLMLRVRKFRFLELSPICSGKRDALPQREGQREVVIQKPFMVVASWLSA